MPEPTIALRPASPADADFVFRLTEACMRNYAVATWGQWDEAATRASFRPDTHRIIQHEGEDIGCVALEDRADHLDLKKLYVLPAFQNRGIGTTVLGAILAAGKPIRLRGLSVNPARRFYERMGFVVTWSTRERNSMEWRPKEPSSGGIAGAKSW
jgi:GNAT superfamily N-acetyltransferase